ncbi:helix-turn-helix domain-containing protein [Roseococcus pinisoli]|uniref:Helix-turn-helix domain-containing protein n=1 Tax=Roseococcus pinisoli TaxID=2835040 RepID=A0ABS5QIB0_9PROT|nr:helix-turn-helix domain-containing protein [Roseococcus pinisoli]MBS7813086.1 helix-turn-helix domain-containing protein [Roseococcus pinisoli]
MKRFRSQEAPAVDAARLGEELRDARLALGLAIEDVAAQLRIRRVYLVALEEGRVRDLPSAAYVVGFVRNYSGFLGLDPDDMVRRLRDAVSGVGGRSADLVFPEPVPERGFPAGVVVLVGAIVAIGAYVAWYNWTGAGNRSVDAVPSVPARLETAARSGEAALRPPAAPGPASTEASSAPTATPAMPPLPVPTPVPVQVPPPAATPAAPAAPSPDQSRITITAKTDVWAQVRDSRNNQQLFARVMRAGETFEVPNREGLVLSTGNARAMEVTVEGTPSPVFAELRGVRREVPLTLAYLRPATPPAAAPAAPPPARTNTGAPRPAQ